MYSRVLGRRVAGGLATLAGGGLAASLLPDETRKRWLRSMTPFQTVYSEDDVGNWPEPIENWSKTHSCQVRRIFKPETVEQVEKIIKDMGSNKLRIMGSGLSPNGIAFTDTNILTLENLNKVLEVDVKKKQVTVEAGALVGDVVDTLAEHGLTLANLASISQQQIGGFTQVGAHGTGASIPPVEEQIVRMEIVSPGLGRVTLSEQEHPEWFKYAKMGLGCFGVVTKVTIQCVDAHKLQEDTQVMTMEEVKKGHVDRLKKNKHLRYMWIPFTQSAVVVSSNPVSQSTKTNLGDTSEQAHAKRLKPMIDLLLEADAKNPAGLVENGGAPKNPEKFGFGEMRDWLLRAGDGILDVDHVIASNKAELEFWKNSQEKGIVDDSSNILGFDCGGQQLVFEVAIPCGTVDKPDGRDVEFMEALLAKVEEEGIPAPAPIEQRWSCGSRAPMSPVSNKPGDTSNPSSKLYTWVGIIMYLPTSNRMTRVALENRFYVYKRALESVVEEGNFEAQSHWAKIEMPWAFDELEQLQDKIKSRFPLEEFNKVRTIFDPKNALTNTLMDSLFRGMPPPIPKPHAPGVRTTYNK